jgi:hypothetical protein
MKSSVLCTQAAEEQDPGKFLELTQEIERLLEEKSSGFWAKDEVT